MASTSLCNEIVCCSSCCVQAENEIVGFDKTDCESGCTENELACNLLGDSDEVQECLTGVSFADETVPTFEYQVDGVEAEMCCLSTGKLLLDEEARAQCLPIEITEPPNDGGDGAGGHDGNGDNAESNGLDQSVVILVSISGVLIIAGITLVLVVRLNKKKARQEARYPANLSSGAAASGVPTTGTLPGTTPPREFFTQEAKKDVRQSEVPEF